MDNDDHGLEFLNSRMINAMNKMNVTIPGFLAFRIMETGELRFYFSNLIYLMML